MKSKLILLIIIFFGLFGVAKSSQAVYPVTGRRKFFLAGFAIFFFIFFTGLTFATPVYGANWYVRPSGGGGTGTSWTSAWNGFEAINWNSVSCGDTIWVAGGTYNQSLYPAKNCTSEATRLHINRARSDAPDCIEALGWNSSYDSDIEMPGTSISFNGNYNYITISGRTKESGGTQGWHVDFSGETSGNGSEWESGANASFITIEYIHYQGCQPPMRRFTDVNHRGIDLTPFGSTRPQHITFSHCKIHGWESAFYVAGSDYFTLEYSEIYDVMSDVVDSSIDAHPNTLYLIDTNHGVLRYNLFHNCYASGVGIGFSDGGPWNNWQVYGNVLYDMIDGSYGLGYAFGVQDANIVGLKLYNNTFVNISHFINTSGGGIGSGCETRNNLYYNADYSTVGTASNNLNASTTGIFNNYSGKNFRIVSATGSAYPRNAGTNLSAYFTKDMDENTFGADGTWDIGAYEYSAEGSDITVPAAPSGLSVQ